jgi:hypothetical protein
MTRLAYDNGTHALAGLEDIMPLITIDCPQCYKVLKSTISISAGTTLHCPTCGASFAMPATTSSPTNPRRRSRRALIAGLAILFLLGVLGIGGYLFFRDRINAPRPDDPLAYVPPDAEFIAGIDFTVLLDDPLLGPEVDQRLRDLMGSEFLQRCQKETGLAPKELLGHALVAGKLKPLGVAMSPTIILQTTRPFDPEKVARAVPNAVRKTSHDKTYFELNEGEMRTLYMPSDRILVLSARPASELDALFTSDGKTPCVSADVRTLIRAVDGNSLWAVVPVEGATRTEMQRLARSEKGNANADPLASALANSKAIAVWGTADSTNLTFGATVLCSDLPSAQLMSIGLQQGWKQQKAEFDDLGALLELLPKTHKAFQTITDGVRFSTDGALVGATTAVSRKAIEEAQKELAGQADMPGVFGDLRGLLSKDGRPGLKKR